MAARFIAELGSTCVVAAAVAECSTCLKLASGTLTAKQKAGRSGDDRTMATTCGSVTATACLETFQVECALEHGGQPQWLLETSSSLCAAAIKQICSWKASSQGSDVMYLGALFALKLNHVRRCLRIVLQAHLS
jgi:hypothetical protein